MPAPQSLHQSLDAAFDAKDAAEKATASAAAADDAVKQAQVTAQTAHGTAGDAAQKVTSLEGQFVNDFKAAIEGNVPPPSAPVGPIVSRSV